MNAVDNQSGTKAKGVRSALRLDRIVQLVSRVYAVFAALGAIWIFALMLLIVVDVVGRNIFAAPIIGVAEIAARSVVAIVFLLLPAACIGGSLIQADLLLRHMRNLSPAATAHIEAVFALAGALILSLIAVASWPDTIGSYTSGEFFGVQGIWTLPTFPFRSIVVGGSALGALGFLLVAMRDGLAGFGTRERT